MGKVYPEEVKRKAVELYRLDDEVTYAQVGRDLGGISGETIRNWARAQVVIATPRLAERPECRSRAGGGEGAGSTVDGR